MPAAIRTYRDLSVWQRAMDLVVTSYEIACDLPAQEDFGLKLQIRRACVSVPANIAEGHGRTGIPEYLHHLSISHGSLMELETHLLIAVRLKYLAEARVRPVLDETTEVSKMIKGLIRRLRESPEA